VAVNRWKVEQRSPFDVDRRLWFNDDVLPDVHLRKMTQIAKERPIFSNNSPVRKEKTNDVFTIPQDFLPLKAPSFTHLLEAKSAFSVPRTAGWLFTPASYQPPESR